MKEDESNKLKNKSMNRSIQSQRKDGQHFDGDSDISRNQILKINLQQIYLKPNGLQNKQRKRSTTSKKSRVNSSRNKIAALNKQFIQRYSKSYCQNFFISKKSKKPTLQQELTTKRQKVKCAKPTQNQIQGNAKVRYDMYKQAPKDTFLLNLKKPKAQGQIDKKYQQKEQSKKPNQFSIQIKIQNQINQCQQSKNPDSIRPNIKDLMLKRNNMSENLSRQNKRHNNISMIDRNRNNIAWTSLSKAKANKKIDFYIQQQHPINLGITNGNKFKKTIFNYELKQRVPSCDSYRKKIKSIPNQSINVGHLPKNRNISQSNNYQMETVNVRYLDQYRKKQFTQDQNTYKFRKTGKAKKQQNQIRKNQQVSDMLEQIGQIVINIPKEGLQNKNQVQQFNQDHNNYLERFSGQLQINRNDHQQKRSFYSYEKSEQTITLKIPGTQPHLALKNVNNKPRLQNSRSSQSFNCPPTFIFSSKDHPYIPLYLRKHNWLPSTSTSIYSLSSLNFTLKWVNNPVTSQILSINSQQYYNHFQKSYQLTSKGFLNTNLRANNHFLCTQKWSPECYDIGNQVEKVQFIQRFRLKVMMSLLENVMMYSLQGKQRDDVLRDVRYFQAMKDLQELNSCIEDEARFQNQLFNSMQLENYQQRDNDFQLNIFLITQALKFYRNERKRYDIDSKQQKYHYLKFDKMEFQNNFQLLQIYNLQKDRVGQASLQKGISFWLYQQGLLRQYYATPSCFLLKVLAKQYVFFSRLNGWKYRIEQKVKNQCNIWILKPSSNARGNGISLETDLNTIVKSAKDIQSRIVQKYVQRPLLLRKTGFQNLDTHKFDIRQWVLLKSLDPLEIYMFSHFYIRLASQKYELYPVSNTKVHLTNYSINKPFFKSDQESIIDSDNFIRLLKNEYSVDWHSQIRPQIKQIIVKSIQACLQKLQDSPSGTCFELLGYDILLDQKVRKTFTYFQMNPWLIEVNMSPACQQRVEWLGQHLKDMNQGLLDIVLADKYGFAGQSRNIRKHFWEKIHFEEYYFSNRLNDTKMQVVSNNYIMKNKLNRQNENIKSKKSFDMSGSPKKFVRRPSAKTQKHKNKMEQLLQNNIQKAQSKIIEADINVMEISKNFFDVRQFQLTCLDIQNEDKQCQNEDKSIIYYIS